MRAVRLVSSSPSAAPTDAELVSRAREGERAAFEALFHRHAKRINIVAFRLLGRSGELDDLVQETFARAFTGLDGLGEPSAFGAWVHGIAVRTAIGWIRRRRVLARFGVGRDALRIDLDEVAAVVATPEQQLELKRIYRAVESMPAEARVALVLHRVDGMALGEVASAMNRSLATVKRRIAEAEGLLAKAVER